MLPLSRSLKKWAVCFSFHLGRRIGAVCFQHVLLHIRLSICARFQELDETNVYYVTCVKRGEWEGKPECMAWRLIQLHTHITFLVYVLWHLSSYFLNWYLIYFLIRWIRGFDMCMWVVILKSVISRWTCMFITVFFIWSKTILLLSKISW